MCHTSVLEYGKKILSKPDIEGKKILEIGSLNINGSLREYIMTLKPESYIGLDMQAGEGVDVVCSAVDIDVKYEANSFDVVICTEMLEHAEDWRKCINNMKQVLKPQGIILISTRSKGFPKHEYPGDYWRFELNDMRQIFQDFTIENLENDTQVYGVFLKATKPVGWRLTDLSNIKLWEVK